MLVIGACLGGCAVIANISSGEGVAPADAGIDGPMSIPSTDGMVSPVETGGGPCAAGGNSADSPTKIHATKVQTPVKIDGDGAEWGCVDRFAFTGGQRVVGLAGGNAVADIAVQWDEANVYFWASVKTASTGDNGAAGRQGNFANDSIHLYLSGPSPNMNYTADDHHLVFDYKNQVADYAIGFRTGLDGIAAVVSPVTNANGTLSFVVEARIESQRIGRPTLKAGDKVRINFQLNDAPNSAGNYRIWFRDVAVCARFTKCDLAGGSEPYCDPRCTGEVELR
jgi:hypothetical protein